MENKLGSVTVLSKSGSEPVHNRGEPLGFDLLSFWKWSSSDLLANAARGIFAEFLVARALGHAGQSRVEWDVFDVVTSNGTTVEVKSTAYLQSWNQKSHSRPCFGVAPTRGWNAATDTVSEGRKRQADVYVLCLLHHRDQATVDPLDVSQWTFFVVRSAVLDDRLGSQKSIGLATLRSIGAVETGYSDLAKVVREAVHDS